MSGEELTKANALNTDLVEALQFEIRNRLKAPSSNAASIKNGADEHNVQNLIEKINTLLGQLHLIGSMHSQYIQFYKQHKYKMKLPALLSEIYEIENGRAGTVTTITTTNGVNHSLYITNGTNSTFNGGLIKKENGNNFIHSFSQLLQ